MALPKGARILPNGDILLMRKDHPNPQPVQGFKQNPFDPWHYINLYKKCIHRIIDREEETCGACNGKVKYYHCTLHDKPTNFVVCTPCEGRNDANVSVE